MFGSSISWESKRTASKEHSVMLIYRISFLTIGLVLLFPALYGNNHYDVYYKLDATLPETLQSVIANDNLAEEYNMNSTHMLLTDADMDAATATKMLSKMKQVDGVSFTLSYNSLIGPSIPDEVVPQRVKDALKKNGYQLMMIGSEYQVASDEVNAQVAELQDILHKYDEDGLLIGEAPATKDLIEITNRDFKVVSILSMAAIFLIILITFRSVTLPVILVAVIELAIMINIGAAFPGKGENALPVAADPDIRHLLLQVRDLLSHFPLGLLSDPAENTIPRIQLHRRNLDQG